MSNTQLQQNSEVRLDESEISASLSSEDDETFDPTLPSHIAKDTDKKLDFNHGQFPYRNITIQNTKDNSILYFADVSVFAAKLPDVTLHANGSDGPVIGASRFRFSRSMKFGIGDGSDRDLSMLHWIDLKNSGTLLKKKLQFELDGKLYCLLRSREGLSRIKTTMTTHFKIVEKASGTVVAYYVSKWSPGRRRGTLTLESGMSQQLETVIVLVIVSVGEKRRRRIASGGGNGGGN